MEFKLKNKGFQLKFERISIENERISIENERISIEIEKFSPVARSLEVCHGPAPPATEVRLPYPRSGGGRGAWQTSGL